MAGASRGSAHYFIGTHLDTFPSFGFPRKGPSKVFISVQFLFVSFCSKPSWKDGSTAVSVLVVNNTLFIANLGDSKVN